jgi:hypothetical protein
MSNPVPVRLVGTQAQKLKAICPQCYSDAIYISYKKGSNVAKCSHCKATGPKSDVPINAVIDWMNCVESNKESMSQ